MSGLIITLPAKSGLAKAGQDQLNFTTSILVDKVKMEKRKPQLELSLPVVEAGAGFVLKQEDIVPIRGKKRRLDHLTWEEKLQRKKLKNRVAAQTSRDRKKARLDELEETVRLLQSTNDTLNDECARLRAQNESLVAEMKRQQKQQQQQQQCKSEPKEPKLTVKTQKDATNQQQQQQPQLCTMCRGRVDDAVPELGSAVSPINPLQQGGTEQETRSPAQPGQSSSSSAASVVLLKILALYLLSRNCLPSSKETTTTTRDSRSLRRAFCEKLPLKWKQLLLSEMNRSLSKKNSPRNLTIQKKWWGRHQVMWKPPQPVPA